jgi:hypothetical protein
MSNLSSSQSRIEFATLSGGFLTGVQASIYYGMNDRRIKLSWCNPYLGEYLLLHSIITVILISLSLSLFLLQVLLRMRFNLAFLIVRLLPMAISSRNNRTSM